MAETIFRKKNLDRMKTPENIDRYIQVANPGGWVILSCILCLLAGVIVWGMFGTIETKIDVDAYVQNETAILKVQEERISDIEAGMTVRIGDVLGVVRSVNKDEKSVVIKADVPDGAYDAEIITEVIKPMSLIFD